MQHLSLSSTCSTSSSESADDNETGKLTVFFVLGFWPDPDGPRWAFKSNLAWTLEDLSQLT